MNKKYIVTLTGEERARLKSLISHRSAKSGVVLNAQILIGADTEGLALSDPEISKSYHVSATTVQRIREKFVLQGLDVALKGLPRGPHTRHIKVDGEVEAQLVRLACSQAPEGYTRWTLRLLADKAVELEYVDSLSHEAVRKALKKTRSSPGALKCG